MRTLFLALFAVLSLVAVARADVGMPGFRFAFGSRVVHFGPEAEKYRLFVVCHGRCAALELLPDHTAQVPNLGPRGMGESLCAVPADTPLPEKQTEEWLKSVPGAVWSGEFPEGLRRDYLLIDPRQEYELHYRATFTTDKLALELIEERTEWSWPGIIGWATFAVAITLLGVWLIRRRQAKRTAPPPPAP